MAHTLHAKLKEPAADENKRGARPQDLIRLYDIILQVVGGVPGPNVPPQVAPAHPPLCLQSLAELSTLQGLEDDHTFQKEVSLKTLVYKAYRWDPPGPSGAPPPPPPDPPPS